MVNKPLLITPPWQQAFAYSEGIFHKSCGMGGQDFGGCRWGQTPFFYLIASLSDGAGSSLFAQEAARTVTKVSLAILHSFIKKKIFFDQEKELAHKIGVFFIQELQEHLAKKAQKKGRRLNDFSATLVSIVMIPQGLFVFQLGDSFCVIRNQGASNYQLVLPLQRGQFVNETNFISQAQASSYLTTYSQENWPEFIALATDGLQPVSLGLPDYKPFDPFFSSLEDFLRSENKNTKKNAALKKFLDSERLNQRTSDDKALFIASFPSQLTLSPLSSLSPHEKPLGKKGGPF